MTDPVDRDAQQKTLTFSGEPIVVPEVVYVTFMEMAAEVGRLCAVIEHAPHAPTCGWQTQYVSGFAAGGCMIPNANCTCWKAGAL